MALLFVPPPQIQKPLSKVFFAVFAVVLVSFGNRKKGQDHVPAKKCMKFILMQTIFTAVPRFLHKTWLCSFFHFSLFHPCLRRFFAAMPPWQSWGQSSWNNWRDDKNKYQFDSDEALQYPEVVTPNTWKSTSTFYDENVSFGLQFHRTIQPTNVCTAFRFFFLKSELKIQLLFCHSIRWPCFHLSKERIENPAIPAFLPFDIVDRFFFPQSGLYLLTTRHV